MDETALEFMRRDTARRLRPGMRGLMLRCASGLLVVTQTGDRFDHVLRPGDVFRTGKRGRVVAWALSDSVFTAMGIGVLEPRLRAA
jgi:hypothetical protein